MVNGLPPTLLELQRTLYQSRNPTRRWLHGVRRDWVLETLVRHGSKQGRALEVGPGCGIYLPALCGRFHEVVASDIEPAYLEQARALAACHTNLRPAVDDIRHTRLPPHSFDLILCTEVIEHLPESSSAVAAMAELLKPGGILVLTTPQRYSPLELAGRVAFHPLILPVVRCIYREPVLPTGHINLLTAAQVESQLRGAGLRILERHLCGLYLPLVAEFCGEAGLRWAQRLESRLRDSMAKGLLWTQCHVATRPV